jgi:hypothetical protein
MAMKKNASKHNAMKINTTLGVLVIGLALSVSAEDTKNPFVKEFVVHPPSKPGGPQAITPQQVGANQRQAISSIWSGGALSVPKDINLDFEPGKPGYTVVYSVTNKTDKMTRIVGYMSSCQCTQVGITDQTVPPRGTVNVRATVTQNQPTVQYVVLQDQQTNLYQTVIWIKPKK